MTFELRDAGDGQLVVEHNGASTVVQLRQCFPWSAPHRHVSLRDGDDEEIAFIDDPSALTAASRQAFDGALAAAGFVLSVTRVLSIDEEVEIRHWTVETDQGARAFQTHLDEWPRALPNGTLLLRDVGGDLYRLPDPEALDARSRQLLWAYVD